MNDDLTDDDPNPPCCPSCGVAYVDHLGLHGTCAVMLEFHADLEASRAEADTLRAALAEVLGWMTHSDHPSGDRLQSRWVPVARVEELRRLVGVKP